ncbi:MAG: efflux RND transporter periplasmic adaptor subunit [Thermoguttaceae bacterium]|nr:efflux RND transporter periplasmic adaptor subunit [Thermoguttaceae bacterium]
MFLLDKRVWVALVLTGSMAFATTGCKNAASEEAAEEDGLPKEPVPVRAVKVETTVLRPSIDVVGTLIAIPERTTSVSPQIAGWIQKVQVVEGGQVRAGDVLVFLDSRLAEAEHAKATAAVAEKAAILERLKRGPRPEEIEVARHDAHKAQVAAGALRSEVEALKPLQARNEVSPVQFQKARSALEAAEAESAAALARLKLLEAGTRPEEIAEAEARLAAARAELDSAALNLQLCKIASPIDGVITQLAARQGMYVERTASVATIVDLSKVFMQVRIPSAYLAQVKPGAAVDVRVASLPDTTFRGSIARIGGQADPATGDVDALAEVANENGLLRPGLACRGRVWLPEVADALVVPAAAIADRAGTPVVTVVREGKASEVKVRLGVQTPEKTQVIEGLAPGETVVTEGGYGLPEGCPVRLVEPGDRTIAEKSSR